MELAVESVLMPSAKSRLHTGDLIQIKFSELFGLCFPRAGIQGARGGHHSSWPGARGGPRQGDAFCISPSMDAEMSHLIPFLGTHCVHRLLPDIPPSP